jgi:deoxycytidine triphosphate deaminase
MIHPAQWIMCCGPDIISPFESGNVNPASYDVTLNSNVIIRGNQKAKLPIIFMPYEFMISTTNEYFKFPLNLAGELRLKSTIGRMGITHCLSVFFDPGFEGEATLEIQNISGAPIRLEPNIKIAQMLFIPLSEPTDLSYADTGRYCGQRGPTPARPERRDKASL